MNGEDNRELVERYWEALTAHDVDAAYELRHEDFVQTWPQLGERIVGRDNARAIEERYPDWPDVRIRRMIGSGGLCVIEETQIGRAHV